MFTGSRRKAHIIILSCEDNDFVKLGKVGQEIVHARPLRRPPAMLPLHELSVLIG